MLIDVFDAYNVVFLTPSPLDLAEHDDVQLDRDRPMLVGAQVFCLQLLQACGSSVQQKKRRERDRHGEKSRPGHSGMLPTDGWVQRVRSN